MDDNKGQTALKSGLWYTVSSILVKISTLLTTPIFTRVMSKADYGISSNFTAWASLLNIVCSLNLMYSIGRAKLDFKGRLDEYVGSMQLLSLLFTSALVLVAAIFLEPVSHFLEMDRVLTILLMVYLICYPSVSFAQSRYRYQYRYKGNIAISAYITGVTAAVSLLLIPFFKEQKYIAKVLGSVLPIAVLALVLWTRALKNKSVTVNLEYWKYGLVISVPMVLHAISLNILSQSDRIMVMRYCGADYNGIYHLAYQYAILINVVLHAVNEAWLPWFHDTLYENNKAAVQAAAKPLVILGCFIGAVCAAAAPEALLILGTQEYAAGQYCVPPIVGGIVCMYIFQQYEHIELHLKKTWFISAGTILAAVLNVILNVVFIPKYGFIAAAYTTMICYFVLMVIHYLVTHFILKYPLFDDGFMFLSVVGVCVVCFGFMFLYDTVIIRYCFLLLMIAVYALTNKKWVIQVLGKRFHGAK